MERDATVKKRDKYVEWDLAHAIAEDLVSQGTDVNEVATASSYLLQSDDADRFFRWLAWMEARSDELARSNQTPLYYRDIRRACERLQDLDEQAEDEQDVVKKMQHTLAWAVRLMRYYPHASQVHPLNDLPDPTPLPRPTLDDVDEPETAEEVEVVEDVSSLEELTRGMALRGTVRSIVDFGVFVDIGVGSDGLVHLTEFRQGNVRYGHVDSVVSEGETVVVWVIDVDKEEQRISLTMKGAPRLRLTDLEPGTVVEGTVQNVVDFGAFVDIGAETDGLVHISEMAEGYVENPHELVSTGDTVQVRILNVDPDRERIGLSMKGLG